MRVGVVIPFGGTDPVRNALLDRVWDFYGDAFPDWSGTLGTAQPFSPGQARNNGARTRSDDVLVFNDADSLCSPEQVRQATEWAYEEPGLVFAFTDYVRLDERGEPEWHMTDSGSSGCIAIRRECFEEVGGYDRRYVGHGFEDLDFANRCAELWPFRRVSGRLTHYWHPRPADEENEHNRELYEARWAKSTA